MGSRAEEEVDRCSLLAADVSSFGVNVSSFHPNVSTFRAHVSSLRPNVSSWGSRRLCPGSPSAGGFLGGFQAETRQGSQPAGGRRWLWRRATTREQGVFTVFAAMCSVFARMCSLSGPMCSVSAPFPPRCVHFPGRCVQSGLTTPPHRRPQRGGSWAVFGVEIRRPQRAGGRGLLACRSWRHSARVACPLRQEIKQHESG